MTDHYFPSQIFESNQQELLVMLEIFNQQCYKKKSIVKNTLVFEAGSAITLLLEIKKMLDNSM